MGGCGGTLLRPGVVTCPGMVCRDGSRTQCDAALPERPMAPPAPRPARRVLVVEDNPDCREPLQALLQHWGHEVDAAGDGQQGVDMALAWRPDTVISDIGLPVLDG